MRSRVVTVTTKKAGAYLQLKMVKILKIVQVVFEETQLWTRSIVEDVRKQKYE